MKCLVECYNDEVDEKERLTYKLKEDDISTVELSKYNLKKEVNERVEESLD